MNERWVVSEYPHLVRVRSVTPTRGFIVHILFTDGTERDMDLSSHLEGLIFEPVRNDPEMFRRVFVDHGALAWPNGADIDSDTLYYEGTPPWAQKGTESVPPSDIELEREFRDALTRARAIAIERGISEADIIEEIKRVRAP